ncbi:hypothetical protein N7455_011356 [Penicillium solitum]|uniref:uncharacterized protein n=1 Tax=Penicillium solitum TaxID=60172 RepID=UPI00179208A7|nr:hypothetical protein HAV15_009810 [Penicillium sp. str. \
MQAATGLAVSKLRSQHTKPGMSLHPADWVKQFTEDARDKLQDRAAFQIWETVDETLILIRKTSL